MKRPLFVFVGILFLSTALAVHAQACKDLGINCRQAPPPPHQPDKPSPRQQDNPSGRDDNDHSRDADDSNSRKNKYARAGSANNAGNSYLDDYIKSHSYSDYQSALNQFQIAIDNVAEYGPAEVGLCRLYGQSGKYKEAVEACGIAMKKEQRQDFANVGKSNKGIRETLLPWIYIQWHTQWYDEQVGLWKKVCGFHPQPSNGGTVDPSFNLPEVLAQCNKRAAELTAYRAQFDKEINEYNKKH